MGCWICSPPLFMLAPCFSLPFGSRYNSSDNACCIPSLFWSRVCRLWGEPQTCPRVSWTGIYHTMLLPCHKLSCAPYMPFTAAPPCIDLCWMSLIWLQHRVLLLCGRVLPWAADGLSPAAYTAAGSSYLFPLTLLQMDGVDLSSQSSRLPIGSGSHLGKILH